jgi:hypothetical protein
VEDIKEEILKPKYKLLINQYLNSLSSQFGQDFYTINCIFGNEDTFSIHAKSDICNQVRDLLNALEIKQKEMEYNVDDDIINEIIAEEEELMIENPLLYDCVITLKPKKSKVIFNGFNSKSLKRRRESMLQKLEERQEKETRTLQKPIKFDESKMPAKYVNKLEKECKKYDPKAKY